MLLVLIAFKLQSSRSNESVRGVYALLFGSYECCEHEQQIIRTIFAIYPSNSNRIEYQTIDFENSV